MAFSDSHWLRSGTISAATAAAFLHAWAATSVDGSLPMEWTLEQARRCWKPMTRAVQHVGVPGYQFQAAVLWDGAVLFGPLAYRELDVMKREVAPLGNNLLEVSIGYGEPMSFIDREGKGSPQITRSLEGGRLPVPHVETREGGLVWHERVFAHLMGRTMEQSKTPRKDDVLLVHIGFKVRNPGIAHRVGHLWLHFGEPSHVSLGYKCRRSQELGAPIPAKFEAPFGIMDGKVRYVIRGPDAGELVWHDEVPAARSVKTAPRNVIEWRVPLGPGREAVLNLVIPYGLIDREAADKLASIDSEEQFTQVVAFWRELQNAAGRIVTPDPFVNDYLAAVAGQMAQQVAWRANSTGVWMYKTSPNNYEAYWPCNAAKALPAFDLRGLDDLNRKILQSFIDVRTDDVGGLTRTRMGRGDELKGEGYARLPGFLGNFGEWTANPLVLSHGLALWALASHYRITRDERWLRGGADSPLKAMIEGFDWVSKQRRRTMREENGKKVAHWGLLPAASAHDWLAGNAIFNDVFCIYGMTEVVRLLREIGHPRAEEMAAELNDYRATLRDRLREARDQARPVPLPDGSSLPYVPRVIGELDWAKTDWTITGYGPLRAGAWGALDPDDELVDQALAFLEAGMPKGEGFYFAKVAAADNADVNFADIADPNAERHYLWRHYVEYETMWPVGGSLFLARDDLPRFFEWLFNNLAFAIHQEWRVGVESFDGVPSCAPGDAERWQTIRRMFINEYGGWDGSEQSLFLLQAIPRSWLRPGNTLSVSRMGTYFGGVADIAVRVSSDGDSIEVMAKLSRLAVTPKEIRMRLRSGDGCPLIDAEVNGAKVDVLAGDTIRLPAVRSGEYHIVGRFSKTG